MVVIFIDFFIFLVGQEPDIPDLIDFMQSGDEVKIINAAGYLQHLCYSKESVKDKVRYSLSCNKHLISSNYDYETSIQGTPSGQGEV